MDAVSLQKLLGSDVVLLEDEPLSKYTGFRTGGNARYVAIPASVDALERTFLALKERNIKHYILGGGKNVLALDAGYDGVVILTTSLHAIHFDSGRIYCEAGAQMRDICLFARDNSLTGMEFAYGIPGTVGGAVFMNAGAYDGEMKDIVHSVMVLDGDGRKYRLNSEDCGFEYRSSRFQKNSEVILSVEIDLKQGDKTTIAAKMDSILQKRIEKQPLDYPSCGSTFRRPEGSYASKLVDDCGLKGMKIGGAAVSEKHAGFLINYSNATSADILNLMERVFEEVEDRTGYRLQPEIRILE